VWKSLGVTVLVTFIAGSAIAAQPHRRVAARPCSSRPSASIAHHGGCRQPAARIVPRRRRPASKTVTMARLEAVKSLSHSDIGVLSLAELRQETAQVVVEGARRETISEYEAQQQGLARENAAAQRKAQIEQSLELIRASTTSP